MGVYPCVGDAEKRCFGVICFSRELQVSAQAPTLFCAWVPRQPSCFGFSLRKTAALRQFDGLVLVHKAESEESFETLSDFLASFPEVQDPALAQVVAMCVCNGVSRSLLSSNC